MHEEINRLAESEKLFIATNWVAYEEGEREEAETYLKLWKKFEFRNPDKMKYIDEQWIERPAGKWQFNDEMISQKASLGLKIFFEFLD